MTVPTDYRSGPYVPGQKFNHERHPGFIAKCKHCNVTGLTSISTIGTDYTWPQAECPVLLRAHVNWLEHVDKRRSGFLSDLAYRLEQLPDHDRILRIADAMRALVGQSDQPAIDLSRLTETDDHGR